MHQINSVQAEGDADLAVFARNFHAQVRRQPARTAQAANVCVRKETPGPSPLLLKPATALLPQNDDGTCRSIGADQSLPWESQCCRTGQTRRRRTCRFSRSGPRPPSLPPHPYCLTVVPTLKSLGPRSTGVVGQNVAWPRLGGPFRVGTFSCAAGYRCSL